MHQNFISEKYLYNLVKYCQFGEWNNGIFNLFFIFFFSHRNMELCVFSLQGEDNLTVVKNYELTVKQPTTITINTQPEYPEKRQLWKMKS